MKGKTMMKKGFTLAEVLITLAIIGVVAALTIPSVILNTNQQEYKTGLKKAVSVLNQAISMNMALDNVAPSDVVANDNMAQMVDYFAGRMNTLSVDNTNGQFYTTDGMRFQFITATLPAAANGNVGLVENGTVITSAAKGLCTAAAPCFLVVDVNGDRKPTVATDVTKSSISKVPSNPGTAIRDVFFIKITGDSALPAGNLAANTMFE